MIASASPFWSRGVHADRRPLLLARARTFAAWRNWFAERDFLEVDTATLQVSPGNEAHIGAFETAFEGPDGRTPLYLHSSPEFACKKLLAAGGSASSPCPMCFATASAVRCTTPSSPCWNGIARARHIAP